VKFTNAAYRARVDAVERLDRLLLGDRASLVSASVDAAYSESTKRVFGLLLDALVVASSPQEVSQAWARYRGAMRAALAALDGARGIAGELLAASPSRGNPG
jgi:hypothetical protein